MKSQNKLLLRFAGEFLASTVLISVGCMGFAQATEQILPSLNFGLLAVVIIHCFGIISGGHANPNITLACALMGYICRADAAAYIAAQFLGGCCGYYLLSIILPSAMVTDATPGLCMMVPEASLSEEQIFGVEFFLTFVLVLVWIAAWDARSQYFLGTVALRIGITLSALAIAAAPLSGASMNTIRSVVPPIFQNDYTNVHIYVSAQALGAIFAAGLWNFGISPKCGGGNNDSESTESCGAR